jgi:Arc/MetJ-type ribon-helix-helix transcriptional regulator
MSDEPKTDQINFRLNVATMRAIQRAVDMGYGNDRSEFIRSAVVEKLERLELLIDRKETNQAIEYFRNHPEALKGLGFNNLEELIQDYVKRAKQEEKIEKKKGL